MMVIVMIITILYTFVLVYTSILWKIWFSSSFVIGHWLERKKAAGTVSSFSNLYLHLYPVSLPCKSP